MIAVASSAAAAETCPDFSHPRLSAGPAIDLGAGLVGQAQSREGRVVGTEAVFAEGGYLVHDCATGTSVLMISYREEPDGQVVLDAREEALALLQRTQANPSLRDIPVLASGAREAGLAVTEVGATGIETCLCASEYPELRGDKVPYEAVQ